MTAALMNGQPYDEQEQPFDGDEFEETVFQPGFKITAPMMCRPTMVKHAFDALMDDSEEEEVVAALA